MRKRICIITVFVMMMLTIVPTGVSAETSDWTYNVYAQTLTSADQSITLYNVRATDKKLQIGKNQEKSFTAIDLTGEINGGEYTITKLESGAFERCTSLEYVKLPDSVTEIGREAFAYCFNLKSVNIPDGVKSIEAQTFLECKSLSSINIPESVRKIGNTAFANCKSLTSIELPAYIEDIGDNAFGGCSNLKTVIINAVYPPTIGEEIFKFLPDDFVVLVPREGASKYWSYTWWIEYRNRVKIYQIGMGSTDHDCEGENCTVCGTQGSESVCKIIKGENSTWQKGSKEGLSFTSDADYDDFLKVQVDGEDIDKANYDVSEGSTIVTLKAEYLGKLPAGEHTIAIVSSTGTAYAKFGIDAVSDGTVQTGDDFNMTLFAGLAILAAAGAAAVGIYRRTEK